MCVCMSVHVYLCVCVCTPVTAVREAVYVLVFGDDGESLYMHTWITYIHTCITYIHTYIIHTYIHTYMQISPTFGALRHAEALQRAM